MKATATQPMTVSDYLDWCESHGGGRRFELVDGAPVAQAPERVRHARVKKWVVAALDRAISDKGLECEAFTDGMTVRIDEHTA